MNESNWTSLALRSRKAPLLGLVIDPTLPQPLHRQIGEQLRAAILGRRLAPGTRLPSSRLMATELDCARGTVLLALDQLTAEGYLVTRAGSGIAVSAELPDEMLVSPGPRAVAGVALPRRTASLLGAGLPEAVRDEPLAFAFGPDRRAFPFPLWAKLLEREWREPPWEVAGALHPFGHRGLREAIASYLGAARGFSCDPRAVVVTTGVRQGIALFARVVLDAGEAAWIEDPCYVGVREALAEAAVVAVPVAIDETGFSADAGMAAAPDARLAVVAPSHHFPLGTVLSLQRRLALLGWAERRGGWVIEDDFDGEYRYAGRPLAPLRALDRTGRVAYVGSFSKLLFPALRLSYLVVPESLVAATGKIMERVSARASLLGQGALARFIGDGHFAAHLRRTRLLYGQRQQSLVAAAGRHLAGVLDVAPDPGGMHLVARPPGGFGRRFDDVAAAAAAAAAGVSVAPISVCYAGAVKAHGLMLGYAGAPEREMDAGLRVLRAVLTGG